MSRRTARPSSVEVRRAGHLVYVHPPGSWLDRLHVIRRSGRPDGGHGYAVAAEAVPLFRVQTTIGGRVEAVVWAGLLQVVLGLIKTAGLVARLVGVPGRDAARLDTASMTDPAAAWAADGRARGLVRVDGIADRARVVAEVMAAAAADRALVLVATRPQADEWAEAFRRAGCAVGLSVGRDLRNTEAGVTVALDNKLGLVPLHAMGWVFVDDATRNTWTDPLAMTCRPGEGPDRRELARRTSRLERVVHMGDARLFGFVDRDLALSPFDTARAYQVYGGEALTVHRPGVVARPVRVAWLDVRGGRSVDADADELQLKQALYWADGPRNRRLARVAHAAAAGDAPAVAALLPAAAGTDAQFPGGRTLVLVENLDHVEVVAKRLPGWAVVSRRQVFGVDPPRPPRGVIATALGLPVLRCADYDVVVRADGGVGLPPGAEDWLTTSAVATPPLTLVDGDDRTDPRAALRTRRRRRAYLAAGWADLGADPDLVALKRFEAAVTNRGATNESE